MWQEGVIAQYLGQFVSGLNRVLVIYAVSMTTATFGAYLTLGQSGKWTWLFVGLCAGVAIGTCHWRLSHGSSSGSHGRDSGIGTRTEYPWHRNNDMV